MTIDFTITRAGRLMELVVTGRWNRGSRGARGTYGVPMEPDEPAHIEIDSVVDEFETPVELTDYEIMRLNDIINWQV